MIYIGNILHDCAIYKIENLVTGDFYIGSSKNAYKRYYNHRASLRSGKHSSIYLQNSYNKYGEDNIMFSVLEYPVVGTRKELYEIEQKYIDDLNPTYNMFHKVFGYIRDSNTRNNSSAGQHNSTVKSSKEYKQSISRSVTKLWSDADYRDRVLSSMRSDSTRNLHKTKSAEVWTRDGMRDKVYDSKMEATRIRGYTQNGLPVSDVYKIRELYDAGIKTKKIAEMYPNLSFSMLQKIAYRLVWKGL